MCSAQTHKTHTGKTKPTLMVPDKTDLMKRNYQTAILLSIKSNQTVLSATLLSQCWEYLGVCVYPLFMIYSIITLV